MNPSDLFKVRELLQLLLQHTSSTKVLKQAAEVDVQADSPCHAMLRILSLKNQVSKKETNARQSKGESAEPVRKQKNKLDSNLKLKERIVLTSESPKTQREIELRADLLFHAMFFSFHLKQKPSNEIQLSS